MRVVAVKPAASRIAAVMAFCLLHLIKTVPITFYHLWQATRLGFDASQPMEDLLSCRRVAAWTALDHSWCSERDWTPYTWVRPDSRESATRAVRAGARFEGGM